MYGNIDEVTFEDVLSKPTTLVKTETKTEYKRTPTIYEMGDRLGEVKRKLAVYNNKLNEYKYMAKEKEKIVADKNCVLDALDFLTKYQTAINTIYKITCKENDDYKRRRIHFLESYIAKNISTIFPNEDIIPKIKFETKRNVQRVYLKITDSQGKERSVKISGGKFMQQLVSFSASVAIVQSFGKHAMYLDEAFSVSSPENLTKVSNLLKYALDSGMQIFLIEQNDYVYRDLPRREFHLHKSEIAGKVEIKQVLDYASIGLLGEFTSTNSAL